MRARLALSASLLAFASAGARAGSAPAANPVSFVGLGGKCLDVVQGRAVIKACSAAPTQRWRLTAQGRIQSEAGSCLDVRGGAPVDGADIVLSSCGSQPGQTWTAEQNGPIRGAAGKCLDVARASTQDGAPVILWPCHGQENQVWRQTPPGPASAGWKAQTVFVDANCTGCREARRLPPTVSGPGIVFYEHPGLDDAVAQWGDCLDAFTACTGGAIPAVCIGRAPCPEGCRRRFQAAAAGRDLAGAHAAFDAVFVDRGAACRPREADPRVIP